MDLLPSLPDYYVRVGTFSIEQAYVMHGLLNSSDIPAVLVLPQSAGALAAYTRQVPTQLTVAVPEDRAEETRELLLTENVVDDSGDFRTE